MGEGRGKVDLDISLPRCQHWGYGKRRSVAKTDGEGHHHGPPHCFLPCQEFCRVAGVASRSRSESGGRATDEIDLLEAAGNVGGVGVVIVGHHKADRARVGHTGLRQDAQPLSFHGGLERPDLVCQDG